MFQVVYSAKPDNEISLNVSPVISLVSFYDCVVYLGKDRDKGRKFKKTGKYYCEYIGQVINWERAIGVKHHTCCYLSCSVVDVLVGFSSLCGLCLTF